MSAFMRSRMFYFLLIIALILIFLPSEGVYAFGAGNIPSFSHMEGRAFRHGDIEDVLGDLAKGAGKGLLGISALGGSKKFSGLDIKRVYFGNWLRDYSQAMDIAGLKKLQVQSIINLCMALGFLAHGYATAEFEVTEERLGVYLPVEHIDNPKGYGEGEDARKYHPKLRGPVDPRELEVDYRTGMKNYIANEDGPWDTSKGHVRKILEQCINMGRRARSTGRKEDEYEAYRLLGTALHTLEDFPAHSNFCELALVSLGYHQVFVHIGDQVRIQAPNGRQVAPLVTGTFGGSDFIHSLLGEASDHISSASVSDLTKEMDKASTRSRSTNGPQTSTVLRELIFQLPGGGSDLSRDMEGVERIRASTQPGGGGGKRPEEMSPQELHATLWQILKLRDDIMKKIENTIEKIPGLSSLIETITDNLAIFIYTTLEPFMKPILQSATTALQSGSAEVINSQDQFEVFNDPRASDPTHSFLSKDHFGLILNEPAGNLAKIIVTHSVQMVAKAWDDPNVHARQVIEPILSCMFHPDFHDQNSGVQREMMQYMNKIRSHPDPNDIARRLSKESVRNHQATRLKEHGAEAHASGPGYNAALQAQADIGNYFNSAGIPVLGNAFSHGTGREMSGDNLTVGVPPYGGHSYSAPVSQGHSPIPTTGEGSQFFSSGPASAGPYPSGPTSYYGGGQQPQYPSPQGPPPQHGGVGFPAPSSAPMHTPPRGPPPLLPPHGAPHHGAPAHGSMYNPSYGGGGHKKKGSDSDSSDDGGYHHGKPKKEKKKKSHKPEAHHQDSTREFPSIPSGFAEPSAPTFPGGPPSFPAAPGFPQPPGTFAPPGYPPPGGFPQQGGYPQPGGFPQPGYGPPPGPPPMFPGGPGGPGAPPSFPGGPPSGPYGQPPDNNTYPGQSHGHHGGYNPNYGGPPGW